MAENTTPPAAPAPSPPKPEIKPDAKPKATAAPVRAPDARPVDPQLLQLAATIAAGAVSLTSIGAVTHTHDPSWIAKQAVAIARALLAEVAAG